MDMMIVFGAAFGSFLQEILHWAEQRNRLSKDGYGELIGSPTYWAVTSVLILATGAAAFFWFYGQPQPSPRDAVLFGAALPALLKKALATARRRHLGSNFLDLYVGP